VKQVSSEKDCKRSKGSPSIKSTLGRSIKKSLRKSWKVIVLQCFSPPLLSAMSLLKDKKENGCRKEGLCVSLASTLNSTGRVSD